MQDRCLTVASPKEAYEMGGQKCSEKNSDTVLNRKQDGTIPEHANLPRIYFSIKLRVLKLCLQLEELGQFGVFSFGLLATCMKEIIATREESQCGHWT